MGIPFRLKCISCHAEYPENSKIYTCNKCGDLLTVEYDFSSPLSARIPEAWMRRPLFSLWKYKELLPILDISSVISLGEGGTRLYKCENLANKMGLRKVYVKFEGGNPTGSFKDRGMTVGISKALEFNMKAVACASTGNTAASLAAYAAKAGLTCVVLVPSGKVALGKIAQALVYGARVIKLRGSFDDALMIIREICSKYPIYLLNSVNPYRLEGQKTIAFEIVEQLGYKVPDNVIVPVGNAGNISAIWKGFKEMKELGIIDNLPRMIGVQARGANPIARAVKMRRDHVEFLEHCETVATAIRIGKPVNWKKALKVVKESKGTVEDVPDDDILSAQRLLAKLEGIFVEPASATTIAVLSKLLNSGIIEKDELTVCIATGHGLKDPEIVVNQLRSTMIELDARVERVIDYLKLIFA